MSQPQMCSVCQSILVYLVLRADYLRGRPGLSSRPCRSPQTGSGPLPGPMCLLNCKRALWREKGARFQNGYLRKSQHCHEGPRTNKSWLMVAVCNWFKREVKSYITSKIISHEDLVSQRVAQNHAHKLPVPRPLDILAALTGAVGWVILEGEGDPYRFSTWGAGGNKRRRFIMLFL